MRLSTHFRSQEFDCHDGTPVPEYAYDDLRDLCRRYLEPLRSRFGAVTIVSGYRTPSHNRAVSGAPLSMHVYARARPGAAADITCRRGQPADWYRYLDARGAPGLGQYDEHVHVDTRRGHARW